MCNWGDNTFYISSHQYAYFNSRIRAASNRTKSYFNHSVVVPGSGGSRTLPLSKTKNQQIRPVRAFHWSGAYSKKICNFTNRKRKYFATFHFALHLWSALQRFCKVIHLCHSSDKRIRREILFGHHKSQIKYRVRVHFSSASNNIITAVSAL